MAKPVETGDSLSKPSRPPRGFPWRLWLFAILMTAGAGAGGYFAWQYRGQANTARTEGAECAANLAQLQTAAAERTKAASACATSLDATTTKSKDLETQLAQLSTNLDASKEELATLRAQRAEADKRLAALEDIQKQFAKMIGAGQLKVEARRGSLVLSLPSEVLFASGSADVSEQGQLAVLEIGITLKKLNGRRFLVVGHTDDAPLKNSVFKDNWELLDGARAQRDAHAGQGRDGSDEPGRRGRRRARSGGEGAREEPADRDRALARDQRAATAAEVARRRGPASRVEAVARSAAGDAERVELEPLDQGVEVARVGVGAHPRHVVLRRRTRRGTRPCSPR